MHTGYNAMPEAARKRRHCRVAYMLEELAPNAWTKSRVIWHLILSAPRHGVQRSALWKCSSQMSCANPVKIVTSRDPRAKKIRMTVRFGSFTPKKYPRMFMPGDSASQAIKQATKDHGYTFPRKRRRPTERCARHRVNSALILVPRAPMMMPMTGGKMPPPTRSMTIESRIRTKPPTAWAGTPCSPCALDRPWDMLVAIGLEWRSAISPRFVACDW